MRGLRKIIFPILMLLLEAACSPHIGSTVFSSTNYATSVDHTQSILVTSPSTTPMAREMTPSLKSETPTKTLSPYPTLTSTPGPDLLVICPTIEPYTGQIDLSGTVIFDGRFTGLSSSSLSKSPSYIVDLTTGIKTEIKVEEQEYAAGFDFSPSGKLLTYEVFDQEKHDVVRFEIISSNGMRYTAIPVINHEYSSIYGWFDDQHLILVNHAGYDEFHFPRVPYPLVIIDIDSLETVEEMDLSELADVNTFYEPYSGQEWGVDEISFNPDFSKAAYLLLPVFLKETGSPASGFKLITWPEREELLAFQGGDYALGAPAWYSDGNEFLISYAPRYLESRGLTTYTSHDLFTVNSEGTIERLTYLSDHHKSVEINGYSGTSDGRFAAFWFHTEETGDYFSLGIHDRETGNTQGYCVRQSYPGTLGVWAGTWSPGGHQLMITNFLSEEENQLLVLDVDTGIIVEITRNFYGVDWN